MCKSCKYWSSYINANAIVLRSVSPTTRSSPAPFTSSNTRLDVQKAFDVIGDRTEDQIEQEKIDSAEKPSTAFVIRNALLIGVNLDDKNLSNLKFVDCDFSGAHIGTDLSDTEFVQCDLFHASGIFLGKAKVVAECLIKGFKTQLKYALDPDLNNNLIRNHDQSFAFKEPLLDVSISIEFIERPREHGCWRRNTLYE